MNAVARRLAVAAFVLAPAWAEAHSPVPGIGQFYNGAFHPFLVPAHLMALIALGLLTGQRGMQKIGSTAVALMTALAAGLAVSGVAGVPDTDLIVLAGAAVVALAVAIAHPLPTALMVCFAVAIGLGVGLGSDPQGLVGTKRGLALAGTLCGAVLAVVWTAAMAEFAKRPWLKIALRVIGSWLAASALLVLALSWIGPRPGAGSPKPGPAATSAPAATLR